MRNYWEIAMDKKLYTAQELSELMQVSPDTIWRWGRQGELVTVRVGRTVRFELPEKEQ